LLPISLIPAVIVFISIGVLFSVISILKTYHRHKKRRSPFTAKFLRGPGQSLIEKLDDINEELSSYLAMMIAIPISLYALYISDLYFGNRPLSLNSGLLYIVIGVLFIGYLIFKMVRFLNLRRITRLGYEGEVATGQELNQMMLQGYHVYHDFVADKFNIDHIVVGPAGVFAVETKARAKPTSDDRKRDAQVTYDGRYLHFPQWKESKPLEQARSQAVVAGALAVVGYGRENNGASDPGPSRMVYYPNRLRWHPGHQSQTIFKHRQTRQWKLAG
jgi:hypothetical protein